MHVPPKQQQQQRNDSLRAASMTSSLTHERNSSAVAAPLRPTNTSTPPEQQQRDVSGGEITVASSTVSIPTPPQAQRVDSARIATVPNSSAPTQLTVDTASPISPERMGDSLDGHEPQRPTLGVDLSCPKELEIRPTKQPCAREEMIMDLGSDRISQAMSAIQSDIRVAVELYLKQYNIDGQAPADFELVPKQGLSALYASLFGTEDWRGRLVQLQTRQPPFELRTRDVLFGLFGNGFFKKVLLDSLPWDLTRRLHDALGWDVKYVQKDIDITGQDRDHFLKLQSYLQICDKEFQETTVAKSARTLAQTLVLTLQQHLRRLPKLPTQSRSAEEYPWLEHIESAIKRTIIMKQKMKCSEWATYRPFWSASGDAFETEKHDTDSIVSSAASIVLTLLPGIQSSREDKLSFPARAMVVTQAR